MVQAKRKMMLGQSYKIENCIDQQNGNNCNLETRNEPCAIVIRDVLPVA